MAAPDDELLARARDGDARAIDALLERHQAQIYRFGLRLCRDPEDARDVLQETLLAMARGVRDFRGASSLSTWLYTIARSYCIKKRRRKKHAPAALRSLDTDAAAEVARIPHPGPDAHEALAHKDVGQALEAALGHLDPRSREVLVLRDVEGLTAPEVADVLGVSAQAVKSRLHRARLAVRAELAPLLGMEAPRDERCPDVLSLFSRHLEDEISADVCLSMERHLANCARCRGACDSLRRTLAICHSAGSAIEVPAEVQASVKDAVRALVARNA